MSATPSQQVMEEVLLPSNNDTETNINEKNNNNNNHDNNNNNKNEDNNDAGCDDNNNDAGDGVGTNSIEKDYVVKHSHFTNLNTADKGNIKGTKTLSFHQLPTAILSPEHESTSTAECLATHYNKDDPLFLPFKGSNDKQLCFDLAQGNDEETYSPPHQDTFGGRLYKSCSDVYTSSRRPEEMIKEHFPAATAVEGPSREVSYNVQSFVERARDIAALHDDIECPVLTDLPHYWSMKKIKNYMKPDECVKEALAIMFEEGTIQGGTGKVSAETAVRRLIDHGGVAHRLWDQRLIISVQRCKSLFSRRSAKDKKDKQHTNTRATTRTILESVVQATETEQLDETQVLQDQSTDVHEVFDTNQTFINKQAAQDQEIEDE